MNIFQVTGVICVTRYCDDLCLFEASVTRCQGHVQLFTVNERVTTESPDDAKLIAAHRNNGEWVQGRATRIYSDLDMTIGELKVQLWEGGVPIKDLHLCSFEPGETKGDCTDQLGYMQWHIDAERRMSVGERQTYCLTCKRYQWNLCEKGKARERHSNRTRRRR